MIEVQFTNESVVELQGEMATLLRGDGRSTVPVTGNTGSAGTDPIAPNKEKPASGRTRQTAAEKAAAAASTGQGISSGEERSDPTVDAQDAKDEAADTAAAKTVDLTHDDVKKLLGGYVMAYGMEAAQADGAAFLGAPKLSEIPNTQVALAAAIIGIAKGINNNPNERELNGDGLSAEKTAELEALVTAAMVVK
jgi:hypothetical protein